MYIRVYVYVHVYVYRRREISLSIWGRKEREGGKGEEGGEGGEGGREGWREGGREGGRAYLGQATAMHVADNRGVAADDIRDEAGGAGEDVRV